MVKLHLAIVLLLVAAGATVGYLVGHTSGEVVPGDQDAELAMLQRRIDELEARETEASVPARLEGRAPDPDKAAAASEEDADGPEDVTDHLPAGIKPERVKAARAHAELIRKQARESERLAARTAASHLLIAKRREEAFLRDQARGGTMAMLRKLDDADAPLLDLVGDSKAFSVHFERKTVGPRGDESDLVSKEKLAPGTSVLLPKGIHRWSTRGYRSEFPEDILIEGAGMDRTLLLLDALSTNSEVRSLTFRDLTVDCGDNYLTDLRSGNPATIRFENVRVVGFDMGAGGSVMLAARHAAFFASGCRFEAGYGSSPGSGNLFRVRSGLLARIEDSVFVGPFSSVFDTDDAATYVFSRCRFETHNSQLQRLIEAKSGKGVSFENCSWGTPHEGSRRGVERHLHDINPAWAEKAVEKARRQR